MNTFSLFLPRTLAVLLSFPVNSTLTKSLINPKHSKSYKENSIIALMFSAAISIQFLD